MATSNSIDPIVKTIDNCSKVIKDVNESSQTLNDIYIHFKEKFNNVKLQLPTDSKDANILWSINTATSLHIGYLAHLLILNILNKSTKTFVIISDVCGYFDQLNSQLFEHETKIKSFYKTLTDFDIGTIIKSDDIYYNKHYQKSLFQLTRSIKINEAIEAVYTTSSGIEMSRASDLMSIMLIINDILYFNITHVIIEEHQSSFYKYIRNLLSNEYDKILDILEIPTFFNPHKPKVSTEINKIFLDMTKDQVDEQFSKLKSSEQNVIYNYFKAMINIFYPDKPVSDTKIGDLIDDIRSNISLLPSITNDSPIYIAISFLTDQFHVLRKHWKKNVNQNDKCTGTGKGIDGVEANQKGFEPPLGGKFIILNWSNKQIVYTLDIDAPAGFFIEQNCLYVTNNRLNYISVIDLISRKEIKRIENRSFNCLHSLYRTENETLLVTSTGIDAIIQINSNGETLNDWYATEHEYTTTPKGEQRYVQRDFDHHHYIYPTLYQTTHINSAILMDSEHFLATLFHQGSLVKINRTNGNSKVLLSGLNCPHAIKRYKSVTDNHIEWMLCNTKQNELLFLNENFKISQRMILEDVNWLQDATQIQNKNILIADANHSRIIEIDPHSNTLISEFFYSTDWRIYQITDLNDFQTNFIPMKNKSQ